MLFPLGPALGNRSSFFVYDFDSFNYFDEWTWTGLFSRQTLAAEQTCQAALGRSDSHWLYRPHLKRGVHPPLSSCESCCEEFGHGSVSLPSSFVSSCILYMGNGYILCSREQDCWVLLMVLRIVWNIRRSSCETLFQQDWESQRLQTKPQCLSAAVFFFASSDFSLFPATL